MGYNSAALQKLYCESLGFFSVNINHRRCQRQTFELKTESLSCPLFAGGVKAMPHVESFLLAAEGRRCQTGLMTFNGRLKCLLGGDASMRARSAELLLFLWSVIAQLSFSPLFFLFFLFLKPHVSSWGIFCCYLCLKETQHKSTRKLEIITLKPNTNCIPLLTTCIPKQTI